MTKRTKVPKVFNTKEMKVHRANCRTCNSEHLADIELDYINCIPYAEITRRYGVLRTSIERHAAALQLYSKRDRNHFYWNIVGSADLDKVSVDNALEAAKQLDRLEHKLSDNAAPANIQVVYQFGDRIKSDIIPDIDNGQLNTNDKDRLLSSTDTGEIPQEPAKI